ncbi:S41 family peptidase [Halanaerocella petrolearia]
MKKRMEIFLLLGLALILVISGCLKNDKLSKKEKLEDFNELYKVLKDNYPYFKIKERETGYNWLAHKDEFEAMVANTQNNIEFYKALKKIVEKVGNGHTEIVSPQSYQNWKELYTNVSKKEKYKDKLAPWVKVLNNETSKESYSLLLEQFREYKDNQNNINKTSSRSEDKLKFKIIKDNKIAYVKIPSFSQDKRKKDYDKLIKFWKKTKDYSNLIIDIRGNSGGSSLYWRKNILQPLLTNPIEFETYSVYKGGEYSSPFIKARVDELYSTSELPTNKYYPPEVKESFKYFSKKVKEIKPKNSVDFSGNIYVLVDENIYSASETFSVFCKSTNWATLIGERTGGDGIGFDPIFFPIPNSGFLIRFPIDMGLNSSGKANEEYHTVPDIRTNTPLKITLNIIDGSDE